jgi:integrase/recombinase XerD
MGELGRKFRQHMLVCGYAESTRESYEQAMVALVRAYDGASPDQLSCDQVQAFIANLVGEKKRAWSTVNVYVSAFRCFYQDVLERKQDQFSLPPRGRGRIRPRVLDRETVRRILEAHTNLKHRALLEMTYGSGLRVSEVCRLKSCHIESAPDRMMVRVDQGKGRKDRYTLLSQRALDVLRVYWSKSQPKDWLFPGLWQQTHLSVEGTQHVYLAACEKVGIPRDRAHGIHMLRHSFASHLMEDGVALPVIQRLLGHSSLSTTSVYCHVSRALMANVRSPGDTLALDGPRNRPAVEV